MSRRPLPYYKMFEDATGIKVTYVRASDTALVLAHPDRASRRASAPGTSSLPRR